MVEQLPAAALTTVGQTPRRDVCGARETMQQALHGPPPLLKKAKQNKDPVSFILSVTSKCLNWLSKGFIAAVHRLSVLGHRRG